jgi:putative tryptophan/tyrosine transport system substrate-binding protein
MIAALRALVATAAIALLTATFPAVAQQATKVPRIAYVWLFSQGPSAPYADAFRERMSELGYVEGKTIQSEYIDAGGSGAKLDAIMEGLVRDKVDIIVAMCTPEALSAKKFTTTIPIIMAATGDPVKAGLVQSMAHPGGNITGVSAMSLPLSAKRVDLLKQAFPKLTQTTVLWNPARPDNTPEVATMREAAGQLGLRFQSDEVRTRDELAIKLDAIGWDGTQSLLNSGDTLVSGESRIIAERAAKLKIPALFEDRYFVEMGGLMSYGPDYRKLHRRAADYVDKILRGAKPGDLAIEQPIKFELVINKKTAKALGMTIPAKVLLQADEVIE